MMKSDLRSERELFLYSIILRGVCRVKREKKKEEK